MAPASVRVGVGRLTPRGEVPRRGTVVDEGKLSSVLSEFARTLATEFPIQHILDHLVEWIVGILPVTSAGVTLIGEAREPRFVAASDASALRYERIQTNVGQGPCVLAYDSGEPVAVTDLDTDERFPAFAAAARAAGLGAVFTFPLRHGQERMDALDLSRETPGGSTVTRWRPPRRSLTSRRPT